MHNQQQLHTIQQISALLHRKVRGSISEEEQAILTAWLNSRTAADRRFFEEALEEDNIEAGIRQMYQLDEEAALADVLNRVQLPAENAVPVVAIEKNRRWNNRYKLAAAAGITGVIVAAILLMYSHEKTIPATTVQQQQTEVQPGSNKAMLTLANGRTIVLDSLQNGAIAREGGVEVNNQNGTVAYAPSVNSESNTEVTYNTLTTPRGGQYHVVLPDGSQVWLNAASSITYPTVFNGDERKVTITGEAYFEVATITTVTKRRKPFIVTVPPQQGQQDGAAIEVLGTHFNVNAYNDEGVMRTTLLEGKVRVVNGEASIGNKTANTLPEVILQPGEQAVLSRTHSPRPNGPAGRALTIDHSPDIDEVMAWKNGLFQFQDASLPVIMRQVARWYNVEIVYNGKIDKQFIGKIPRRVPLSTLLQILESTGWVHFTTTGNKVIVSP